MAEPSNFDHRAAVLALLSHALKLVKQLPLNEYDPPSVIRAMTGIENVMYEVEHAKNGNRT